MAGLFCGAIFLSSCLLFLVQPLCAKMLLPYLGGTPAVWNTCMVFFQAGLLLGYAYAHFVPRWLGVGRHAIAHLVALLLTFFLLPIGFPAAMIEGWHPVLWLLAVLSLQAGIPFVLIAGSGPLLQSWFVRRTVAMPRDPYFLYSASNLGSFAALALFPLVLEPNWSLVQLSELWRLGFLGLVGLLAVCAPVRENYPPQPPLLRGGSEQGAGVTLPAPPSWWVRGRWIVLAMIPSSLLLSVTTYLTTDIAAIPLLWVIPMGIYLLTFALVFAPRPPIPQAFLVHWMPFVVVVLAILLLSEAPDPLPLVAGLHLLGLFWLAMVCHGELARTRPAPAYLTDFYLCLAGGGVLGGILNALVAPLVFSGLFEYPLMIVLACYFGQQGARWPTRSDWLWAGSIGGLAIVLVLALQSSWLVKLEPSPLCVAAMFGLPLVLGYVQHARPARYALSLGAVFLASWFYPGIYGASAYRERSYYGIHRVTRLDGFNRLVNGNTLHGMQNPLDPHEPLAYYSKAGPIGDVFRVLGRQARKIGVVGLGTGSLAAYARPGQQWTFFEIDPSVKRIAENPEFFTYLRDARAIPGLDLRIELGDARLQLQKTSESFDLLVIDAFGSDAIPVHLLTREALDVYLEHLQPGGVLVFHVSNRYVDLEPVLAALARAEQLVCYVRKDRELSEEAKKEGFFPSEWVVLARAERDLEPLLQEPTWRAAAVRRGVNAWTDGSSNLLQVFRWGKDD